MPSRNSPCPCGSGKKYKKCCLGRAVDPPISASPFSPDPDLGLSQVRPVADPSGHTEGAPPFRLTPYTIAKIAENPEIPLDPALKRKHERHLREGWTICRVAGMSTEEIEAQLRSYGVDYSRDGFLEQTSSHTSAWSLSEPWASLATLTCVGKERDFLGLAACELWKRLLPTHPSEEMLDDWMQEGYVLEEQAKHAEASTIWWRVWEVLRSRFDPGIRTMHDAARVFSGMQSVFNWSQDFQIALANASPRDTAFARMGRRYCNEWIAQFVDEEAGLQVSFRRTLAAFLINLGETAAAEATLRENVSRWPGDPWGYVALADAHSGLFPNDSFPVLAPAQAIAWLERGLAAVPRSAENRDVLEERLAELRKGAKG